MKLLSFEDIIKVIFSELFTPEGLFNAIFLGIMVYIYETRPKDMINELMNLKIMGAAFTSNHLQEIYTEERYIRIGLIICMFLVGFTSLIIVHRSFEKHGAKLIEKLFNHDTKKK